MPIQIQQVSPTADNAHKTVLVVSWEKTTRLSASDAPREQIWTSKKGSASVAIRNVQDARTTQTTATDVSPLSFCKLIRVTPAS